MISEAPHYKKNGVSFLLLIIIVHDYLWNAQVNDDTVNTLLMSSPKGVPTMLWLQQAAVNSGLKGLSCRNLDRFFEWEVASL